MSIYTSWGFFQNPFLQTALEADDTGATLLVGRDVEMQQLTTLLTTPPRITTVEGLNGVGKTSLVNVAVFHLYRKFTAGKSSVLYLPCKRRFQLSQSTNAEGFIDDIFSGIAQSIIDFKTALLNKSRELKHLAAIDQWLNSPRIAGIEAGLQFPTLGASVGYAPSPNTSGGFERSGFRRLIREWLSEMYELGDEGGVVCVIDNLELLETSESLRACLERLRDEVLTVPGIRPVLCGANGIILSSASSPRLSGLMQKPLEVKPVSPALAHEILHSRQNAFSITPDQSYLPITPESFSLLYDALGKNLRSLLQYADEYCMAISVNDKHPTLDREKDEALAAWLNGYAHEVYKALDSKLTARNWELFDAIIQFGGAASPSDYATFGFNSLEAMRPHAKALEETHLIVSVREESDKRRKSMLVTANGYLAKYHRKRVHLS